jgi:hypothetical protein
MFVIAGDHFKVLHPIGTSTQIDEHPSS